MGTEDISSREVLERHVVAQVVTYLKNNPQTEKCFFTYWERICAAFPGMPSSLIEEAMSQINTNADDLWWQNLEQNVSAEIVRRAMAGEAFAFEGLDLAHQREGRP